MSTHKLIHLAVALILSFPIVELSAAPLGTAFTYQGRLEFNGAPVNDTCEFQFSLWGDPNGVTPVGVAQTILGVTVSDGLFTVELNEGGQFGPDAFTGEARWLEIAVKCSQDVSFTPLSPFQPITAAPYARYALNAPNGHSLDAADGDPVEAVFVNHEGEVGVGTTHPMAQLHVVGGGGNPGIPVLHVEGTTSARINLIGGTSGLFGSGDVTIAGGDGIDSVLGFGGSDLNLSSGDGGDGISFAGGSGGDVWIEAGNGGTGTTDGEHGKIYLMAGRVGIGTSSPSARLQVFGDGVGTVLRVTNGGDGNTAIIAGDVTGTGKAASFYGVTSSDLITVHNDGSGKAAKFTGDVDFQNGGELLQVMPNSPANYVTLGIPASHLLLDCGGHVEIDMFAVSDYFKVTQGSSSDLFYVGGNGNVGIGTQTPDEKLHVIGIAVARAKDKQGSR